MMRDRASSLRPCACRFPALDRRASILILALWSVCLLSVFAVILNAGARQKITLVQRLDLRERLSLASCAGVKKGLVALEKRSLVSPGAAFGLKDCLKGSNPDMGFVWTMTDEERKININLAQLGVLKRLFQAAAGLDEMEAQEVAASIIDWRDADSDLSSIQGGAENSYYRNLSFPYSAKNSEFEVLEELLLVKGISEEVYAKVKGYLTVFGEGQVNVNTCSLPVLLALGLDPSTADKVLEFRLGPDREEGTADDKVFDAPSQIVPLVSAAFGLEPVEKAQFTQWEGTLVTTSRYFMIRANAHLTGRKLESECACVADLEGKLYYWRQS
jgi:hypothetical protein